MLNRSLILFITILSGCAQLQPVGGSGRFLQYNTNGQIFMQFDTSSPDACKREGNAGEKNVGVEAICSTVSQEAILPSFFTITNPLTGEQTKARVRTPKACEIFRTQFSKVESLKNYDVSKCE